MVNFINAVVDNNEDDKDDDDDDASDEDDDEVATLRSVTFMITRQGWRSKNNKC